MACTTRCTRVRGTAALALPGSCTALDTPARRAVVNVIADGRASGDASDANPMPIQVDNPTGNLKDYLGVSKNSGTTKMDGL